MSATQEFRQPATCKITVKGKEDPNGPLLLLCTRRRPPPKQSFADEYYQTPALCPSHRQIPWRFRTSIL